MLKSKLMQNFYKLKTFLKFSLLAITVIFTTACSENDDDTLKVNGIFEVKSFNPVSTGLFLRRIEVAQNLVYVTPEGKVIPQLLKDWSVSKDSLTWSFNLKEDVYFHNNVKMTADLVIQNLLISQKNSSLLKNTPIKEIKKTGDYSFNIVLNNPYRALLGVLGHYSNIIIDPSSYDESGKIATDFIYATGPYKIVSADLPHMINMERFEEYYGEKAIIEKARYLSGHRSENRALQIESGDAHVAFEIAPESKAKLGNSNISSVNTYGSNRFIALKINHNHELLTKKLRKAIDLSLDKKAIASDIMLSPGFEAYQIFPKSLADWHLEDSKLPYKEKNIEKAKQIFASLGWKLNSNSVLEKDGKLFKLELITYADRPELTKIATAIQAQLNQVGIMVDVQIVNSGQIPLRHKQGTLQMALIQRNLGNSVDPFANILQDYSNKFDNSWGAMGFDNKKAQQLLLQMEKTIDDRKYRELAQEFAKIANDELALIPVYFYAQTVAISKDLEGFEFDPFEINYHISKLKFINKSE